MPTDQIQAVESRPALTLPSPAATSSVPESVTNPRGIICAAIVAAAFLPLFFVHAANLWERPHYQFAPLVLIGCAVIALSRWRGVATLTPGDASVAFMGFAASWLMLLAAEILISPSLAVVSFLVLLAFAIYRLGGELLVRAMLPAWFFLWILVPLPFGLDRSLVLGMQYLTSYCTSYILDYFDVYHFLSGNVIEISGGRLLVEEACAGVNSLFAILACTLFLVLWLRRPWPRALVLLSAGVFWVLVSNVIRVFSIAVAKDKFQFDLSEGLRHDLLGLACFLLAVTLIWSTDRLLLFFKPTWGKEFVEPERGAKPAPTIGLAGVFSTAIAGAFGLILALHFAAIGIFGSAPVRPDVPLRMASIDEDSLPKVIDKWEKVHFDTKQRSMSNAFGEHSKIWYYRRGPLVALIAIDYPFAEFHDLWVCYNGQGWEMDRPRNVYNAKVEGQPDYWMDISMSKPGKHFGYLAFSEFNPNGDALEYEGRLGSIVNRHEQALNKIRDWAAGKDAAPIKARGPAYQFQVFVESSAPLTEQEQADVNQLYFQALDILHGKLFGKK